MEEVLPTALGRRRPLNSNRYFSPAMKVQKERPPLILSTLQWKIHNPSKLNSLKLRVRPSLEPLFPLPQQIRCDSGPPASHGIGQEQQQSVHRLEKAQQCTSEKAQHRCRDGNWLRSISFLHIVQRLASAFIYFHQWLEKNGRTIPYEVIHRFHQWLEKNGRTTPCGQPKDTGERSDSGPSASYTAVLGNNYYIFLSFRGPDTRKGFVDHLYHKLVDVGLHHPDFVFRDDENLRFGQPIADNLLAAIQCSKISIPIISETYAASEWCLREIIEIMECVERGEQKVYPVLYKVQPYEVRHMLGKFGDAFRGHEHRFAEEVKQQGPKALKKALERRIFESEVFASGYEGKLVKELVETIMLEQQHDFPPSLPEDLVGIDENVARVMNLADTTFSEARIIVIYGIGGIGKTTLATVIYKQLFDKFQCHGCLNDIRETIKSKGMDHVQSLLISDITKSSVRRVRNSGIEMIRRSCEKKKVLILLDDVDSRDHLDKLIGGCDFESGSRIIITCRDRALLKPEYKEYELKEMNMQDALRLFRKYAFEGKQTPTELATLSIDIVVATGKIPLALVIIGSFLKRKDENIWKETLGRLKKVPHMDVQQKLRISYDSLGYEEKQMFLDIACFFIGVDKRIVAYLWEDSQYHPNSGLERMVELSLIKVDDRNELRMHDHLRALGRAIARPVDKKPWECSRLWDEEAITVQRSKDENRNIEALRLDEKGSSMFMEQSSYKRMPYLRFLHLSEVNFFGNFKGSLSELRWLEWEMCPEFFMATNVHLEKLLILDLSGGFISEKWQGWSTIKMEQLKVLNLTWCSNLRSIPNLSALKSLERLTLEGYVDLAEIGPSLGDVKCLVSLNVRGCRKLKRLPAPELGELKNLEELLVDNTDIKEFPDCIGSLKKLKTLSAVNCSRLTRVPTQLGEVKGLVSLNLSGCLKLQELPAEMCELEELKELIIGKTAIKKLPPLIGCLKKLEILDASDCWSLDGLPESIGSLVKLQRLLLCHTQDPEPSYPPIENLIPDSIGKLEWLTELDLSRLPVVALPESIGDLKNLKILKIARCKYLTTLPSTIRKLGKLEDLDASNCNRLGGQIHIDGMSSLRILQLSGTRVSGFPDALDELSCLEKLDLSGCKLLQSLPQSIIKLHSLQHLDLTNCYELQLLPELPPCLAVLKITGKHGTLPPLSSIIYLKELSVSDCPLLGSMPELPSGLLKLRVSRCSQLEELPNLSNLGSLSELDLCKCIELTKIEGLEALKSLEELYVSGCPKLSNLHGLEHVGSLRRLTFDCRESDAPLWTDDLSLVRMKHLEVLRIRHWKSLRRLDLSQITHLKELSTRGCSNLVEIKGLLSLTNLETWDHHGCTSLSIPDRW